MKQLLKNVFGKHAELLEIPATDAHGDLALPCFSFAKELKQSPQKIAAQLKTEYEAASHPSIEKMEVAGGYLNFFLNREAVAKEIVSRLNVGKAIKPLKGKSVIVEHTSINPNSSPHIGRARGAFIGDCIVRLLRYLGAKVDVHYFVNDIGKQISLLVYALKDKANLTFNDMLQEYINANEELKQNPEIEKTVFAQLEQLEKGDPAMQAAFKRIVDICLEGQQALFGELGIFYDYFDFESQFISNGEVSRVINQLKKTGKLFEDENGRYVVNLEGHNVGTTMLPLTRADKTSLYPLRDVCYHIYKAKKKADINIIVLGEDQKMYYGQINAVANILGYKPIQGVFCAHVLLQDGKMSTRAGNVVMLEDVMRQSFERTGNKVLGYGAIKYAILSTSATKTVLFDWDIVLNTKGDSGVYLQYAYARINSICNKSSHKVGKPDIKIFTDNTTWKLLKKVYGFDAMLDNAAKNNFCINDIAFYLHELAQLFSKWYAETKIAETDNVWLAQRIGEVIKDGLHIMGIEVLKEI